MKSGGGNQKSKNKISFQMHSHAMKQVWKRKWSSRSAWGQRDEHMGTTKGLWAACCAAGHVHTHRCI